MTLVPALSQGAIAPALPDRFAADKMTCRAPVHLTRDCSDHEGPTRPIALRGFRFNLAGSTDGRTLFINQIRYRPDHNGRQFAPDTDGHQTAIAAIKTLRRWLHSHGACLERWEALRHAGRVRGYLLTFSDNVYPPLHGLTLLESEHWLPNQVSRH